MQSRYDSAYTTPANVSDQLQKADTGNGSDSISTEYNDYFDLVKTYCLEFSKVIETTIGRTFVPYLATKTLYFSEIAQSGKFYYDCGVYVLELSEDLLSINSLTFMDTSLTSDKYRLVDTNGDSNGYPYGEIHFDPDELPSWDMDFGSAITIVGEWGLQDNESDSYSSITTSALALDASETGVSVATGSGALFNIYQYIRIDNELMFITSITVSDGNPDVLTVVRGVNGFTAATHLIDATITRWNVVSDISLLATRMVAYWFNKRNDAGERVQVIDTTLVIAQFAKELSDIARRRQIIFAGSA